MSLFLCMPALWCQHRAVVVSNVQANVQSSSATITWNTNLPANSTVNYGVTTSYASSATDSTLSQQHSITLSNLSPATLYDYQVVSGGTHSSVSSPNYTFQTLPASTPANAGLWSEIASDMTGQNEGMPHGVPSSWDWAQGPVLTMGNNANGWRAMTAWGVVYEAAEGNPATNTRVNIRDVQLFFLQRSTGAWLLLQNTSQPQGAAYLEDFSGDVSKPGDVRQEPDGTMSVTAGGGYNFHFWPADRASINPNDIGGILVLLQARLIVGDPTLPDDRAIARYLAGAGADYYPALTGGWPGNLSYNPGVGNGKMKYVQSEWRFFAMTTLTADQLASNPPPVDLTGVSP